MLIEYVYDDKILQKLFAKERGVIVKFYNGGNINKEKYDFFLNLLIDIINQGYEIEDKLKGNNEMLYTIEEMKKEKDEFLFVLTAFNFKLFSFRER